MVVDNYLLSEQINDCGLKTATPVAGSNLTWVATATSCPGGASSSVVLSINRGCATTQTIGGTTVKLINTCVSLTYPYRWQYGNVAGLFGATFSGPTSITTNATAFNEN